MEEEQEYKKMGEQARGEKYWKSKHDFIKYHIPVLV
jgi:hypothetical protein